MGSSEAQSGKIRTKKVANSKGKGWSLIKLLEQSGSQSKRWEKWVVQAGTWKEFHDSVGLIEGIRPNENEE